MKDPNFLIIGAPKAGTTSIYHFLSKHPQVYMPELKEPRFFALEGKTIDADDPVNKGCITTIEDYKALFSKVGNQIAIGEASPMYFANEDAPEKIKKYLGSPKIIALVRNPIERTYSHYLFALQQGYEPADCTLTEAVTNDSIVYKGFTRVRPYVKDSLYFENLSRFMKYHSPENLLVINFDDFIKDANKVIANLCVFLGIDPPDSEIPKEQFAKSGKPKNVFLHRLVNKSRIPLNLGKLIPKSFKESLKAKVNDSNLVKPKITAEEKQLLRDIFKKDVEQLSKLLNKDFEYWLK
jgi:hypothetical protein